MKKADELLKIILRNADCGSNSCQFTNKKGGMRTNGPCLCFSWLSTKERNMIAQWYMRGKNE